MGYAFMGTCYEDAYYAHTAFQATFPMVDPTSTVQLTTSSVNATGLVTFTVATRPWTSANATTTSNKTLQFTTCSNSYVNKFETLAVQDVVIGVALALVFVIGFVGGFRR